VTVLEIAFTYCQYGHAPSFYKLERIITRKANTISPTFTDATTFNLSAVALNPKSIMIISKYESSGPSVGILRDL